MFDINQIILGIDIILIVISILTLEKPIIGIIGMALGGFTLVSSIQNACNTFVISFTVITVLLNLAFFIIGLSRNRGI